jgi:hypothetical protein
MGDGRWEHVVNLSSVFGSAIILGETWRCIEIPVGQLESTCI